MTDNLWEKILDSQQHKAPKSLNRRKILTGAVSSAGIVLTDLAPVPALAKTDPVVQFMKRSAKKLLNAAQHGSPKRFLSFISRYTDLSGIALYCLGNYKASLQKKHQRIYFQGTARHITRYFTYQSRKYQIAKADVGESSWEENGAHYVDTKVTLLTGSTYNVRWQIVRRNGRFKIANVRVLGFWLLGFQRKQFVNYIVKKGGKVTALVAVLHARK